MAGIKPELCEACLMDTTHDVVEIGTAYRETHVPATVHKHELIQVCEMHAEMIEEWKLVTQCAYAGIDPEGDTDG